MSREPDRWIIKLGVHSEDEMAGIRKLETVQMAEGYRDVVEKGRYWIRN